jgi:hypothetical protein
MSAEAPDCVKYRCGKPLSRNGGETTQPKRVRLGLVVAVGFLFGLSDVAASHSGIVDGYGCHRGSDKVSYHCHQGQFAGRTFKSKEDFLRELRGGKSQQLSPKNNPIPPPRKNDDSPAR